MQTIPAREIKRRGMSAVDDALAEGPVYVIKNDRPCYVILNREQYQELVEAHQEAYLSGIREALKDVKEGRVQRTTAEELIRDIST